MKVEPGTDSRQRRAGERPHWTAHPMWQIGIAAALVAAVANVVVYEIARGAGVPLELTEIFEDHYDRMPVYSFVLATLLDGGLTATVTATGCRRWAPRPRAWFVWLAVIGLVTSFAFPLATDGTAATVVVLLISHVVAAVIIVPPLALALPARRAVA